LLCNIASLLFVVNFRLMMELRLHFMGSGMKPSASLNGSNSMPRKAGGWSCTVWRRTERLGAGNLTAGAEWEPSPLNRPVNGV